MTEFIEKHHILKETQSGYRKELSTSTVAIKLRNDIYKAINKGKTTLAANERPFKSF